MAGKVDAVGWAGGQQPRAHAGGDRAAEHIALHQLADDVLAVGRAAAVAAHQQLAAGAEAGC